MDVFTACLRQAMHHSARVRWIGQLYWLGQAITCFASLLVIIPAP